MKFVAIAAVLFGTLLATSAFAQSEDLLGLKVKSITGEEIDMAKYKGKVLLVVNVATKCGLTGHYEGLEKLHEQFSDKGLAVLGFPCNQFGGQEPGTEAEIAEFCKAKYSVKFDMFSKIDVNGANAAPLYKTLTAADAKPVGSGKISWNFEKIIIGRDGKVAARFSPRTAPADPALVKAIEAELAKK